VWIRRRAVRACWIAGQARRATVDAVLAGVHGGAGGVCARLTGVCGGTGGVYGGLAGV
jgi:hypothetical protein